MQFADDTCSVCSGDNHTQVKDFLCRLGSLAGWIATKVLKMQVNMGKSSVMCFLSSLPSPPL